MFYLTNGKDEVEICEGRRSGAAIIYSSQIINHPPPLITRTVGPDNK